MRSPYYQFRRDGSNRFVGNGNDFGAPRAEVQGAPYSLAAQAKELP